MKNVQKYLLNFDKPVKDLLFTPIYRVFSLEKFLTSLNSNHLFLFKAKHLEDSFEAFLLKQMIWKRDGTEKYPFQELYLENFFIQSWTFLEESYLLWNAYAPNKDGIIVKSTIGRMMDLFLKNTVNWGEFFLGKMEYWTQEEIIKFFEDSENVNKLKSDSGIDIMLKSLFIKRKPFMHEDEVRLLYVSNNDHLKGQKISQHGYTFESKHLFNELAEELVLDPRIDPIRADSIVALIKKLGYSGQIKQSTLYDSPILKLRVD